MSCSCQLKLAVEFFYFARAFIVFRIPHLILTQAALGSNAKQIYTQLQCCSSWVSCIKCLLLYSPHSGVLWVSHTICFAKINWLSYFKKDDMLKAEEHDKCNYCIIYLSKTSSINRSHRTFTCTCPKDAQFIAIQASVSKVLLLCTLRSTCIACITYR
jgi:hypothetical protein